MKIIKNMNGTTLEIALEGRLDTLTSTELATALEAESGFTDVRFDFAKLEYLSSSGLRLLFAQRKKLGGKEHVILTNVNPLVSEILRVTGFDQQVTVL